MKPQLSDGRETLFLNGGFHNGNGAARLVVDNHRGFVLEVNCGRIDSLKAAKRVLHSEFTVIAGHALNLNNYF